MPERVPILDFSVTAGNPFVLALTPQPASLDMGLFVRPFTPLSWRAILAMTAVLLSALLFPHAVLSGSEFEGAAGYMMAYTVAWYFFVLLNAFYGGALTMFFTSQVY